MTWPAASVFRRPAGASTRRLLLVGAYIVFLFVLLLVVMRRAGSLRARRAASAEIRPKLQAALVEFLAGGTDDSLFRSSHPDPPGRYRGVHSAVSDHGGRQRPRPPLRSGAGARAGAPVVRGVPRRATWSAAAPPSPTWPSPAPTSPAAGWPATCCCAPLNDGDEEVRLSACRGLVLAGDEDQIEDLFALAIQANLLTRIVLTEDLRRHATALAAGPVREALRSGDPARVRATLEILVAWERAIPLEELGEFLEHRDRDIRMLAFRLASFVTVDSESRLALLRSLHDADAGDSRAGHHRRGPAEDDRSHTRTGTLSAARGPGRGAPRGRRAGGHAAPGLARRSKNSAPAPTRSTALAAGEALARARKGA